MDFTRYELLATDYPKQKETMVLTDTQAFYDDFADAYRFIFADWEQSVQRQAGIISAFLEKLGEAAPKTVLDCTCGIGTQAIGLAMKGYQVTGTDLSPNAIERAKEYAANFDAATPIRFYVADLLHAPDNPTQCDIVLAFDNPIAHFDNADALLSAFQTMAAQVKDGGLLTTSLRDYDSLVQEKPRQSRISVTDDGGTRRIVFQVWDWFDDDSGYDSEMFVITQDGDGWQTQSYKTRLRAWQRVDVSKILVQTGLSDVAWHMPEDTGYYQPIVTARKG